MTLIYKFAFLGEHVFVVHCMTVKNASEE